MATQASSLDSTVLDSSKDTSGIGDHPRALTDFVSADMWVCLVYGGRPALLFLNRPTGVGGGGSGSDTKPAASIYGAYTGSVYLMSIPGGWFADNVLGTRRAVFVG